MKGKKEDGGEAFLSRVLDDCPHMVPLRLCAIPLCQNHVLLDCVG